MYLCKYRTLLKTLQETGLCVSCIQYVCVCARALVCVCVWVFVLVRPPAWERYTQDYENSFSCLLYSLWCETTAQYPSEWDYRHWNKQDKENRGEIIFWELCGISSRRKKRNLFSSECQLTSSQTWKESVKERTDKTFMDKAAQPCVQTFVSKDTSRKGGKKEEKKTVYCLDISHIWKYGFTELTFLVITKRFLFSPFSANEKKKKRYWEKILLQLWSDFQM